MGAAGSISLSSVSNLSKHSSAGPSEYEEGLVLMSPISPTGLASDIVLPGPVYRRITKPLVDKCKQSWLKVASNSADGVGIEKGFAAFCGVFFFYMDELDVDNDVLIKFQPRPSSFCVDRDALLLRVINFILSIPSDNFKVKSKIRALGRAHARVGIVEKHFEMFTKALLKSVAIRLGPLVTTEIIGAWLDVLSFAVHQLTFDKINFKTHHNTDKEGDFGKDIEIPAEAIKKYEELTGTNTPGTVDGDGETESKGTGDNGGSNNDFDDGTAMFAETKEITPQFARSVLETTEEENT
jgi:hemoglobin-like flavoprotein